MIFIKNIVVLGLQVGDELLVLNGLMVSELDMVYIESVLESSESLSLTIRSCRCIDQAMLRSSAHMEQPDEVLDAMIGRPHSEHLQMSPHQQTDGSSTAGDIGHQLQVRYHLANLVQ